MLVVTLAAPEIRVSIRTQATPHNVVMATGATEACAFLGMPERVRISGLANLAQVTTHVADHRAKPLPRAQTRSALAPFARLLGPHARRIRIVAACRANLGFARMAARV